MGADLLSRLRRKRNLEIFRRFVDNRFLFELFRVLKSPGLATTPVSRANSIFIQPLIRSSISAQRSSISRPFEELLPANELDFSRLLKKLMIKYLLPKTLGFTPLLKMNNNVIYCIPAA